MFGWLKKKKQQVEYKSVVSSELMFLNQPKWGERGFESLANVGYKSNSVTFACIDLIGQASQNIPLLMYDGEKEITEHPIINRFHKPNLDQSGAEFMYELIGNYLLSGNAYVHVDTINGLEEQYWYNLRPNRIETKLNGRGQVIGYIYTVNVKGTQIKKEYRKEEIIHIKKYNPTSDYHGHAAAASAGHSIDTHNSAASFIKSLLDNSAMPSGALVYRGTELSPLLTEDQRKVLKQEIENNYSGSRNAGRPMLLEGGLDWKEMGVHPKNMEFIEAKREAARDIALAFGVPPLILGIPGDNTYANYREANRAFYRQSVMPMMNTLLGKFACYYDDIFSHRLTLTFDKDKIEALAEEQDALFDRLAKATFLTDNEKRLATGYNEDPRFERVTNEKAQESDDQENDDQENDGESD